MLSSQCALVEKFLNMLSGLYCACSFSLGQCIPAKYLRKVAYIVVHQI